MLPGRSVEHGSNGALSECSPAGVRFGPGPGSRFLSLVLVALAACAAPRVQVEEPWTPPAWVMPTTMNTLAKLSTRCPLPFPVKVEIEPIEGYWGLSWFDEDACMFRIVVNPHCSEAEMYAETLRHEWAHCMTTCECEDPHCDHWGAAYAQCYRAVVAE